MSCESYDNTLGYYDCVTKAAEDTFVGIMGCVPPWFSDNEELVCQNEDIDYVNNKLKVNMSIYTNKLIGLSAFVNFCCFWDFFLDFEIRAYRKRLSHKLRGAGSTFGSC